MYKLCLSVCLFVCPFVSKKRLNRSGPISHDPREGLLILKITKICVQKFFIFVKFSKLTKKSIGFLSLFTKRRCLQIEDKLSYINDSQQYPGFLAFCNLTNVEFSCWFLLFKSMSWPHRWYHLLLKIKFSFWNFKFKVVILNYFQHLD